MNPNPYESPRPIEPLEGTLLHRLSGEILLPMAAVLIGFLLFMFAVPLLIQPQIVVISAVMLAGGVLCWGVAFYIFAGS